MSFLVQIMVVFESKFRNWGGVAMLLNFSEDLNLQVVLYPNNGRFVNYQ